MKKSKFTLNEFLNYLKSTIVMVDAEMQIEQNYIWNEVIKEKTLLEGFDKIENLHIEKLNCKFYLKEVKPSNFIFKIVNFFSKEKKELKDEMYFKVISKNSKKNNIFELTITFERKANSEYTLDCSHNYSKEIINKKIKL
jgi:hypothetical protein